MKIALLGPISTAGIAQFLHEPPPADFPPGVGGAPIMATLIGALLEGGHEVCAITCGGFWSTRDNQPLRLNGERFEFHCVPVRKHSIRPHNGRIGRILDFFAHERHQIGALLVKSNPDIVHAHWTYEYAMAAIDSSYPYLVTVHDDPIAVLKLFRNVYRFGRYLMARNVLRKATALTAVSKDLHDRLTPLSKVRIEVIPNPLDRRFTSSSEKKLPPSSEPNPRFISVINGWGRWKNASTAIRAFAMIRKAIPEATYHLFGSDFQPSGVAQKWAKNRSLAEGLHFHGPVSHAELINYLKQSNVMLHPSRWEACPMGIAEAMALGLPVIGGKDSGGVAWMIDGGGLTVDVNRPEAIAEAALQLISNDVLYQQCSNCALERVKQFAPEIVANQYLQLYKNLLAGNNAVVPSSLCG